MNALELPPQGEADAAFCRWCESDRFRSKRGALVCSTCDLDSWKEHK
ncbi:uncharacterized Zn finger protein (UPF0148 family) [Nocardioides massiliensis]|uniref:Uncharacterized Zn finger protein (UPF0148 family) n=1 Tax=Nocardioides massiliensis TaxID=1325935 RepID=A0ABT9NKB7_9ACTN|nr:uncharacterized Zn finger protein (UPF0148 family) [Nocardioides massiliensis]